MDTKARLLLPSRSERSEVAHKYERYLVPCSLRARLKGTSLYTSVLPSALHPLSCTTNIPSEDDAVCHVGCTSLAANPSYAGSKSLPLNHPFLQPPPLPSPHLPLLPAMLCSAWSCYCCCCCSLSTCVHCSAKVTPLPTATLPANGALRRRKIARIRRGLALVLGASTGIHTSNPASLLRCRQRRRRPCHIR